MMKCDFCHKDKNCGTFQMPVEGSKPIHVCKKCIGQFAANLIVLSYLDAKEGVVYILADPNNEDEQQGIHVRVCKKVN